MSFETTILQNYPELIISLIFVIVLFVIPLKFAAVIYDEYSDIVGYSSEDDPIDPVLQAYFDADDGWGMIGYMWSQAARDAVIQEMRENSMSIGCQFPDTEEHCQFSHEKEDWQYSKREEDDTLANYHAEIWRDEILQDFYSHSISFGCQFPETEEHCQFSHEKEDWQISKQHNCII